MERFGIKTEIEAPLDQGFMPMYAFEKAYLVGADRPVTIAVEGGHVAVKHTFIHATEQFKQADAFYLDRTVKTMLWVYGGSTVYVNDKIAYDMVKTCFSPTGTRAFDVKFMSEIYEREFNVVLGEAPKPSTKPLKIGGGFDGCRIGFDAGGSDMKISSVLGGKTVFSDEIVWQPKLNADPKYHYDRIVAALKTAASHLPRVDGVGISSAGIYIDNRTMRASLFLAVPESMWSSVKDIYIRAVRDTFGDIPFAVVNDGDVSALAGAMTLGNGVLGIAMGTSEAGGYVNDDGLITGWLNELAFVPIDVNQSARDEWSGDYGCGVKYFSQDAVVRLAKASGINCEFDSPAQILSYVQSLLAGGDECAQRIFDNVGVYLGHTLPLYYQIYECRHVLLLGRVMSGKGGEIILDRARNVLKSYYPEFCDKMSLNLPDERFRRVGQSMAAAGLPVIKPVKENHAD